MKPASGLLALTVHLAVVSSISFGGFPTVLPDVRAFVVSMHGWITDQDFTNIFAMAQAIPPEHDPDDGTHRVEGLGAGGRACRLHRDVRATLRDLFRCVSPDAPFSGSALAARAAIRAHSCDHGFDYRERYRDGTGRRYHLGSHRTNRRRRCCHADDTSQSDMASGGRRRLGRPRSL